MKIFIQARVFETERREACISNCWKLEGPLPPLYFAASARSTVRTLGKVPTVYEHVPRSMDKQRFLHITPSLCLAPIFVGLDHTSALTGTASYHPQTYQPYTPCHL
jgi:hypothetical protein